MYTSVRSVDLPYVAHFLVVFIVSNLHKFVYNKQLAGLASRRVQDGVDGVPFVVGSATLLRHLGPAATQACCCLLIQFARSQLEFASRYAFLMLIDLLTVYITVDVFNFFYSKRSTKEIMTEIPSEFGTTLALIEQWSKQGLITRTFLNSQLNEGAWSMYKVCIP